jgi:hypothetical protein
MTVAPTVAVLICGAVAAVTTTVAQARAAAAPSYQFVDLGKSFSPSYENQDDVVVGGIYPSAPGGFGRHDSLGSGVWVNGKVTPLAGDGYAFGLSDAEQIAGQNQTANIIVWSGAKHTRKTFAVAGATRTAVFAEDEATGNLALFAEDADNHDYAVVTDIAGNVLQTLPTGVNLNGVSQKTFVGTSAGNPFIGVIATGHETPLDLSPRAMASDGSVIGSSTADNSTVLRLPNGTETTVAIDNPSHVNARHDIISATQILPAGSTTAYDASQFLPAGWTLSSVSGLGDDGSVLGYAVHNNVGHGFMLKRPAVSGTVYGVECGATTCSQHGLKGQLMLLTGKKSNGVKYSATDKTDAHGNYFIDAPAGSYQVGAAGTDGKAFVGPAFDPEWWPVTMKSKPITGKDFHVCAPAPSGGAKTTSAGFAADAASNPDGVTFCQSVYTVTMQATLPGEQVVDPSTTARYNTKFNPREADYRDSTGYVNKILHTKVFQNKGVGVRRQFPACMDESLIHKLDKNDVDVSWYSSYLGGDKLGSFKVVLAYNQEKGVRTVRTVGTPKLSPVTVYRLFRWRYRMDGKTVTDSCTDHNEAVPVVVPISGAEPGESGLDNSQFAIMVAWAFPFAAPGTNLSEEGGIAAVLHEFGHLGSELYKDYEHLSEAKKFIVDSIIGLAIGGTYVKAVGKASSLLARLAPKLKYLPHIGGITAEWLHRILLARDIVNVVAGYAGEYPVMGTVLRGNFVTRPCPKDPSYSCGTILSLNAEATKFPDIQLKIVRDAETATYTSVPVYSGKALPWRNNLTGTSPESFNPYSHNAPYLITDTARSGQHLSSGKGAIENIDKDTENLRDLEQLVKGVEEGATPAVNYKGILGNVKDPDCNENADVTHDRGTTLCYIFTDGRA